MNTAKPSSPTDRHGPVYRFWEWCRRNPGIAALVTSNMILLMTVTVGSTIAAVHIAEERNREVAERERARREYETRLQSALEEIERLKQATGNEK
jgi:hypothetical protein